MEKKSDNPDLARDLESLLEQFDNSDWSELELQIDGLHLYVARNGAGGGPRFGAANSDQDSQGATTQQPKTRKPAVSAAKNKPASQGKPAASPQEIDFEIPEGMEVIRASNVGTFYRSPKPGDAPYVDVGDKVAPETEVCLIEVMKLFSPLTAGVTGVISEVLLEDAQMVEFDQPIFLVQPE